MEHIKKMADELECLRLSILQSHYLSINVITLKENAYYDFKTEIQMNLYTKKRNVLLEKLDIFYRENVSDFLKFISENKIVYDGQVIFDYYID